MALGTQIKKYREKLGMRTAALAERVSEMTGKNVEPATIAALEKRDSNTSKYAPVIAQIFGMTVDQLLDETRDYMDNPEDASASKPIFVPVPILDIKASCGNGYDNGDNVEILGNWNMPLDFLKSLGVSPANAEILFSDNFSMFPTIRPGSHVMVNKADREVRIGKIYAINIGGEMLLKRIFNESGNWVLRSDNPDKNEHPDRILKPEELSQIYGRVIWFDTRP